MDNFKKTILHKHLKDTNQLGNIIEDELSISFKNNNINDILYIKNIYATKETFSNSFRVFFLIKLPKSIFPDGYLNVFEEKKYWHPFYISSGKNSSREGSIFPYFTTMNLGKDDIHKYIIKELQDIKEGEL